MADFTRGPHTLSVKKELHSLNRKRLLDKLTACLETLNVSRCLVLLEGGSFETRHCSDHEPLFRQESYFHWTFGVQEPDFFGSIEVPSGRTTLYAPLLPQEYEVWMGKLKSKQEIRDWYAVDEVVWSGDLKTHLKSISHDLLILTLNGLNTDSGKLSKEASFEGISEFRVNNSILHPIISELRVFKTPLELEVLRFTAKISSEAHTQVMKSCRAGMKEYQLESIFQHYCYFEGGARFMSYTCICASGNNGSTLHYGHSGAPNSRTLEDNDMCLFDMGCEYYCYASDITCSFPVSGKFSEDQKIVYNAVLKANRAVMSAVKPGVSWTEMHLLAERIELQELKAAGLLTGSVDDMMDKRLGAIFMPHGLGHFMGIDTHDVGGYLDHCPPRSQLPGLKSLRTARLLEENMVLTIEPGIYFIDCLLNKALADDELKQFLVPSVLERFRGFGGIRIEDDIVVTSQGMELLSPVPRSIEEIEAVMEEGRETVQVVIPQSKLKNDALNGSVNTKKA